MFGRCSFLDFSILVVRNNDSVIHHYNPFTNIYQKQKLQGIVKMFPDKLGNMNKYPLRIPVFNLPPFSGKDLIFELEESGVHRLYLIVLEV